MSHAWSKLLRRSRTCNRRTPAELKFQSPPGSKAEAVQWLPRSRTSYWRTRSCTKSRPKLCVLCSSPHPVADCCRLMSGKFCEFAKFFTSWIFMGCSWTLGSRRAFALRRATEAFASKAASFVGYTQTFCHSSKWLCKSASGSCYQNEISLQNLGMSCPWLISWV